MGEIVHIQQSSLGQICPMEDSGRNGRKLILILIYINPNSLLKESGHVLTNALTNAHSKKKKTIVWTNALTNVMICLIDDNMTME